MTDSFLKVTSFDPLIVQGGGSGGSGGEGPQGPAGPPGPEGPAGPAGGVQSVDGQTGDVNLSNKYVPVISGATVQCVLVATGQPAPAGLPDGTLIFEKQ